MVSKGSPGENLPSSPKYTKLLGDPVIQAWYDNHNTPLTANEHLRRLGRFCGKFGVSPQDIVSIGIPPSGSPEKALDWLIQKKSVLEKEAMSGNYISNHIKAIKSWLQHNHVILPREPRIHIKGRGRNRKYSGETPPSPKELQDLFEVADPRQKVTIALIALTGVRPRTIGNFDGSDGLRISDFPELHIDSQQRKVTFERIDEIGRKVVAIPTLMTVREEINKGESHGYLSFLNEQGCHFLKLYLENRMTPKEHVAYDENGKPIHGADGKPLKEWRAENITNNSPIVAHNHPINLTYRAVPDAEFGVIKYYEETFVPAQNISDAIIAPVIEQVGIKQKDGRLNRPYVLRGYFDHQMMDAEADKNIGVIFSWRKFWMGHTGEIEAVYTTDKALPQRTIEQMREAYRQASDLYLTPPRRIPIDKQEMKIEFRRESLAMRGMPDEEIEKLDLGKLTAQELQQIGDDWESTHKTTARKVPRDKVVSVSVKNPLQILKTRLAEGEISLKEFERLRVAVET
jgi:hypothetical protein